MSQTLLGPPAAGDVLLWSHMVTRLGVRELRDSLTRVLRRVRAGETVEITSDGEPVAVLSPYEPDVVARLVAAGRLRPPSGPLALPERVPPSGRVSASDALAEGRGD